MSLYASSQSTNRIPAPSGAHVGRCYGVIDLGTHINPQNGKGFRKILLQFELPTELHTFREENGPEPFVVSREFGLSLSEKSHLRPFLEGWRGRPFTPEELAKFDVMVLAGLPCFINIIHNTKGDKTYANIASVMTVPKGMQVPPGVNPVVTLSLNDEYNHDVFSALPEWIQKKIQESPEYKSIVNDSPTGNQEGKAGTSYHTGMDDGDIPFNKPHYLTVGGW
jgi:hypothetical protein